MPPLPVHPFPMAEERGDGIAASGSAGANEAILMRLRAEEEVNDRSGPQHAKMASYVTPRLEKRAALGGENEAYSTAVGNAYSTGYAGSDRAPQSTSPAHAAQEPSSSTLMQERQQAISREKTASEALFGTMV